jgi:hypothetical protein
VTGPEADAWLHPAVELRPSEIAGRGLFATQDLPAGCVVLRWAADADERVDQRGTRFPNHSCDPNLGWAGERALLATTDVPAGAELVTDYAMGITEQGWVLRCHCPSYRCRQMVEATDWRIPQLQARYAGSWAPDVQRLVDASRSV